MNSFFHWTDTRDKSQVSPLAQVHLTGDDNQIMWVKWPALYGMNKITYLRTEQQRQIRCYLFQILQTLLPHNWAVYRIKKLWKYVNIFTYSFSHWVIISQLIIELLSLYFDIPHLLTLDCCCFYCWWIYSLAFSETLPCLFFLLKYMTKNKDKLIRISFLYCSFVAHLKRHCKLET